MYNLPVDKVKKKTGIAHGFMELVLFMIYSYRFICSYNEKKNLFQIFGERVYNLRKRMFLKGK